MESPGVDRSEDLKKLQRKNRAKLLPPAPKSEQRVHVEARPVAELKKPERTHEDQKVIIRIEHALRSKKDDDQAN